MPFCDEKIQQYILRNIAIAPKSNRSWLFDRLIQKNIKYPDLVKDLQHLKKWILLALDIKIETFTELDIAEYFGRFYYDFFDSLQSSNPWRFMEPTYAGILNDREYSEELIRIRGSELGQNELESEIVRLVETKKYLVYLDAVKSLFDQHLDYSDPIKAKLEVVNKKNYSGKWAALFCKYINISGIRTQGAESNEDFVKTILDFYGIGLLYRRRSRIDYSNPDIDTTIYIKGVVEEILPLINDGNIARQLKEWFIGNGLYKPI